MGGHGEHSWEEVVAEASREPSLHNLYITLLANESRLSGIGGGRSGTVKRCRVTLLERVCPGPKALSQAGTDRNDESGVRVVREKCFKAIDVDWSHDAEEGGVVRDCPESDRVKGFRERRTGEGQGCFRPFGDGGSGCRVSIPKVVT